MASSFVIGVDFGTDSVRSVVVDASNGNTVGTGVHAYSRWAQGLYCAPVANQFRQHPLDYIEGLEKSIKAALASAPSGTAAAVKGIAVDTTGSTPCAVDVDGNPLALRPEFSENPNAMFVLWKDHTALDEAAEINRLAKSWGGEDFTKFEGGIYSSEWFWAKILHVLREDSAVRAAAHSWVEHCDWIPALLSGVTKPNLIKRSRCAAGHKAMWHPSWKGLPPETFLFALDPMLSPLRARLYDETETADKVVGTLAPEWVRRLGLHSDVTISGGAFDCHMGVVGGGIEDYDFVRVMGTSSCDMLVAPVAEIGDKLVRGICGQVEGSIIPGKMGLEAGQSGLGDLYSWYKRVLMFSAENIVLKSSLIDEPLRIKLRDEIAGSIFSALEAQAQALAPGESGIVALDWMNGRRTPDANQALKGAIAGLNLGSDAPRIYRALVEATAFGARKIVDRYADEGIKVRGVIAMGGVSKASTFVMQVLADVLKTRIRVVRSDQACALGAAMFAAVGAGLYADVSQAQQKMQSGFEKEYFPNAANAEAYDRLYERYSHFGYWVEHQFTPKVS